MTGRERAQRTGKRFLEDRNAQLKVLNVETILGVISTTTWEKAAADKCIFFFSQEAPETETNLLRSLQNDSGAQQLPVVAFR